MANLIREQRLIDSTKRALIKYVIVSDGTQQANSVLVDVSTLSSALNTNGYIMTANADPRSSYNTTVKRVFGNGQTAGKIKLQWQGATNSEIVTFGNGQFEYSFDSMGDGASIPNPEASTNGDILISTAGLGAGDLITIIVDLKKDGRSYDQGQNVRPNEFNFRNSGIV